MGIELLEVAGIDALRVGPFLVMNGDAAKQVYPDITFVRTGQREFHVFQDAQRAFHGYTQRETSMFSLYDLHSRTHSGRLVFPHGLDERYYEPSCGTGTVAVGIAMVENGEIDENGDTSPLFETGGDVFGLGGPDTMELPRCSRQEGDAGACQPQSGGDSGDREAVDLAGREQTAIARGATTER